MCNLKNPGMYESCPAYAPICNHIQCPWGQKALNGYMGSDKGKWKAYEATGLIAKYTGPKNEILIEQGTSDGFLDKKQLMPEVFVEAGKEENFPVKLRLQDGYDHSYFLTHTFIEDHIKHHAEALYCRKTPRCMQRMLPKMRTLSWTKYVSAISFFRHKKDDGHIAHSVYPIHNQMVKFAGSTEEEIRGSLKRWPLQKIKAQPISIEQAH